MHGWLVTLTVLVSISSAIAVYLTILILREACQRNRVTSFDIFRIVLYRVEILTRTTSNCKVFLLGFFIDCLSIATALMGIPVAIEMISDCELSLVAFTLMLDIYQMIALIRMAIVLGHFLYGRRFWRWVKRRKCCYDLLNACEYE